MIYRIAGLGMAIFSIVTWLNETASIGVSVLLYASTWVAFWSAFIFLNLIIVTAIDLRKGFWGIASGLYMPLGMSLTFFSILDLILYFGYILPGGYPTFSLGEQLICVVIPIISILEWLLFEEKGTVGFSILPLWYMLPSIYLLLILVRPTLWSDAPLLNGAAYPYRFLSFDAHPVWHVWINVVIVTVLMALVGIGLILLNNLVAGKYRRRRIEI